LSVLGGAAYRAWMRAPGPTFVERLRALEEEARLDAEGERGPEALAAGRYAEGAAPEPRDVDPVAPSRGRGAPRDAAIRLGALDPDRASAAEWERLPGIGPALAARIVEDRAARGPFRGPEGLRRVRGIGRKTVDRLRPFLRQAPADSASPNAN
jgi:competence protein ComEA